MNTEHLAFLCPWLDAVRSEQEAGRYLGLCPYNDFVDARASGPTGDVLYNFTIKSLFAFILWIFVFVCELEKLLETSYNRNPVCKFGSLLEL
jgi:hypothetical protein